MKLGKAIAVVLAFAAPLALAKDKKDNRPSALFLNAQFVYVQAEDGTEFNPNVLPEDRDAIANVLEALGEWKRYTVTYRRSEADLVIVVRKGRLATAKVRGGAMPNSRNGMGGATAGQGQDPADPDSPDRNGGGIGRGIGVGGEAGMPNDTLRVFSQTPDGHLSGSPIWWREMQDGLNAPDVMLLAALRREVDRAYPPQASKKP